jgi:FSR family fosmidomycin resistance protein-like MFS transporter
MSQEKSAALGVFVSPGAFGIFLGKLIGKQDGLPVALVIIILFAAAALILRIRFRKGTLFASDNAPVSFDKASAPVAIIAAACLFLVVCLRSYAGMTLSFSWKGEGYWGWALITAVVLGKNGRRVSRRPVRRRPYVRHIAGSFRRVVFPAGCPDCRRGRAVLFNMTMPVTLWAMAQLLPSARGFSFGLLTFGLFRALCPSILDVRRC